MQAFLVFKADCQHRFFCAGHAGIEMSVKTPSTDLSVIKHLGLVTDPEEVPRPGPINVVQGLGLVDSLVRALMIVIFSYHLFFAIV